MLRRCFLSLYSHNNILIGQTTTFIKNSNKLMVGRHYFLFYKHFCSSFITKINSEDDYMFDSLQPKTSRMAQLYPYNIIQNFKNIHHLRKWKENTFDKSTKFGDLQIELIYTSLIARCIELNRFEYGWQLFEEAKEFNRVNVNLFATMFQFVFKKYTNRDSDKRTFDRKAVKYTKNLENEMKNVYNIKPTALCYGVILKIYVQLNEFELAEKLWNEYLNGYDQFRSEIDLRKHDDIIQQQLLLEHSILWNYVMSLYRRQNKLDKVFEIYNTILTYNVMQVNISTFIQVLVAISQIISSQMEKSHNVPKQQEICGKYIHYAETVFVDAHNLCKNVNDPKYGNYVALFNSLMQCYQNAGNFHAKCRNFWKLMYTKDIKYLSQTLEKSNYDEMDNAILNQFAIPNIDEFTISQMIQCLRNCCQCNIKYDNVTDQDIYEILDEILHILQHDLTIDEFHRSSKTRIKYGYQQIFFKYMELCLEIFDNSSTMFDHTQCYKYMFKFYNYFDMAQIKPTRIELSFFNGNLNKFFKYQRTFKTNNIDDIDTVHGCINNSKSKKFIESQAKKYRIDKNQMSLVRKGHNSQRE